MCPEVDEANPSVETSPAGRAVVGRCHAGGAGGSGLACSSCSLRAVCHLCLGSSTVLPCLTFDLFKLVDTRSVETGFLRGLR